jgi:hypothetical protein
MEESRKASGRAWILKAEQESVAGEKVGRPFQKAERIGGLEEQRITGLQGASGHGAVECAGGRGGDRWNWGRRGRQREREGEEVPISFPRAGRKCTACAAPNSCRPGS